MKSDTILNPEKYGSGCKLFLIKINDLIEKWFCVGYNFFLAVKGILRQAMHEIPLITLCTPFLIAGCGLIVYHTYRYEKNDGNNKKYKLKYTRKYSYGCKIDI